MNEDWIWALAWIVGAVSVGLIGCVLTIVVINPAWKRHKKRALNRAWATSVNKATSLEAVYALGDTPYPAMRTRGHKVVVAKERYQQAKQSQETTRAEEPLPSGDPIAIDRQQKAVSSIDQLRQRENELTYETLEAFLDDQALYPLWLSPEDDAYLSQLQYHLTKEYSQELLQKARLGDADSLAELAGLVLPDPEGDSEEISLFEEQTGEVYDFPPDWNELIVRLFENPRLEAFVGYDLELGPGALRLMASKAQLPDLPWLEQLVRAQRVLAYADWKDSDDEFVWRSEIGENVLARISDLVVAIHHAQQLVFTPATPVE